MNFEAFSATLSDDQPSSNLPILLKALWFDAKGDWDAAHNIAQSNEGTPAYDQIHAYLHRVEGDTWNAGYWYRRAGVPVFEGALKEEWKSLVIKHLK